MCVHEFGEDWQYNATESILAEDMFFDCDEDFDDDDLDLESFAELSRWLDLCEVRRWSELVCRRLEPRACKGRPGPT